jgi:beta-lactam-binding protein with PASTA domain
MSFIMSLKRIKKLIATLILHIGLMSGILCGLIWLFFQWGLPALTKHGQAITVPNLKGIPIEELKEILAARHLRYKLTEDIIYLPSYPPSVVLEQYPKPGAHVKEGRSIYITLNAAQPPEVTMPNLVDGSVRNAHITLKSRGLAYNTITYVTDIAKNAVLEQWYNGQPIEPGTRIPQGSKIDLIVGAGLNKHMVAVPDLIGMSVEEAELLLLDAGMCAGKITYEYIDTLQAGTVFQQQPKIGSQVNLGHPIYIWAAEANPATIDIESKLDNTPIIESKPTPDADESYSDSSTLSLESDLYPNILSPEDSNKLNDNTSEEKINDNTASTRDANSEEVENQ